MEMLSTTWKEEKGKTNVSLRLFRASGTLEKNTLPFPNVLLEIQIPARCGSHGVAGAGP